MANMPSFVKVENDKIIFNGGPNKEMVAYIPEKYFSSGNIAEIDGKYTNLIGKFPLLPNQFHRIENGTICFINVFFFR